MKKHVKDSCQVQMVLHYKYAGVNFFHILAISYKYLCLFTIGYKMESIKGKFGVIF
jgi:hypothetical protein